MADEQISQSGGEKTPEQQLAELLRQSRGKPAPTKGVGINLNFSNRVPKKQTRINWQAIGISLFAAILVFGTGYFLLLGLKFNVGEVTFELNEAAVGLKIDNKPYGTIDTGYVVKLKAGKHILGLTKDGFLELEKTIEIVRGDKILLNLGLLPIPSIDKLVEGNVVYPRLNRNGLEVAYYDPIDGSFKSSSTTENKVASLFRGSFSGVGDITWSPVTQAALVKLTGQLKLKNMQDNRQVRGRYIVLGERPTQGASKYIGTSTWFFDDSLKTSSGWQPVALNESIRQVAYSNDGAEILYIYDTADGEYSLVRALPSGEEWERVIVDLPQLDNPKMIWGADDRYLLIESAGKLLLVDLVAKSISEIVQDRVAGSQYAISSDGAKLAYVVEIEGKMQLKTYEFATAQSEIVEKGELASTSTPITWLSADEILIVAPNQTFIRININNGDRTMIPFVGQETNLQINSMEYSSIGKMLMLTTTTGIFVMKI